MQKFLSSTENSKTALGHLLSQFSFISSEDIAHAQKLAAATGLPLGKCFVLLDCISQDELLYALEAQALLRDGVVSLEQLVKAMESVRRGWSLADALTMLGLDAHSARRTRLGELLSDAGTIDVKRLNCALRIGEFSSLPLGRVLVSFNAIDEVLIEMALKVQSAIRRGGLDRQTAVERLKVLNQPATKNVHMKIGELLIQAGVLTEAQIFAALAKAEQDAKLVGEILVETEQVSEEVIATSLCLQELLDADLIDSYAAANLIGQVAHAISSREVAPLKSSHPMTFFDFLRATGYLDDRKLTRLMSDFANRSMENKGKNLVKIGESRSARYAMMEIPRSSGELRNALLAVYPNDRQLLDSGFVIFELIKSSKLSVNQGLVLFGFRHYELKQAS